MKWPQIKKFLLGAVRVQAYAVCVAVVVGGISLVHAQSRAKHMLGELGIGLLEGLGGLNAGVEQVELNGERFTFGAAVSDRDPESLVSEFEQQCGDASGSLAEDLGPLFAAARKKGAEIPERDPALWTSMRESAGDKDAAHGGCFVRPDDTEKGSLLARLEQFAQTGKLGTLGGFRYLRADRDEDAELTRVLAIASQGELDIDALVPEQGDAKGTDPTVAARPVRSVRQFSARILGSDQGAYVYESEASEAELLAQYDADLPKKGLSRVALDDGKGSEMAGARSYAAPQGAVVVAVQENDDGKRSITVIEFGDLRTGR